MVAAWARYGGDVRVVASQWRTAGGSGRRGAAHERVAYGTDQWARKHHAQEHPGAVHGPMVVCVSGRSGPKGPTAGACVAWRAGVVRPALEGAEFPPEIPSSPVQLRFSQDF
jgi:hypothetical protein